jgi:hypothetical protein
MNRMDAAKPCSGLDFFMPGGHGPGNPRRPVAFDMNRA